MIATPVVAEQCSALFASGFVGSLASGSEADPREPFARGFAASLPGRPFTVVGAGKSGLAAANILAQRGADVRLVEARPDATRPETLDARAVFLAGTNAVRPGDVAVLSPGVPEVSPLRREIALVAAEVIGEIELFYRLCPAPILAVTGTDGKSTVTTMLGDIMRASGRPTFVGGNLGNPLCEGLSDLAGSPAEALTGQAGPSRTSLTPDHVVVAEVSCFQLTTCRDFRPRVAVVTNIAEDHTDYHGSFEAYQAAKRLVWRAMTPDDTVVLWADDPFIDAWRIGGLWPAPPSGPRVVTTSAIRTDTDARRSDGRLEVRHPASNERLYIMMRDELPLLGEHNVLNALAAAQMAVSFGVDPTVIRRALMAYRPLPHRLAHVATIHGVRWVDDSKATNPNAASAGLRAIDGPVILLLGGSSKDTDFRPFATLVRDRARAAICYGATGPALSRALGEAYPHALVDTLAEAVAEAARRALPGDTVLLAPACASFDQFRGYAHRGQVFTELVTALR